MTPLPLLRLHDEFCLEAQMANYRPSTLRWWKQAIHMFVGHFPEGEVRSLQDASFDRLRRYLYDKRIGGWSADTFSNQYRALRAFFNWTVEQGHLPVNPLEGIKRPRLEKKLPKRISKQEAERLLTFAFHGPCRYRFQRYRDRALVALMLYAGLRLSETINLLVSDVDLLNGVLHVRCGKGAKDRVIPFLATLRQVLLEYLRQREQAGKTTPFFFCPAQHDRGLSAGGLKRIYTSLRERSGVNFSAHKLRHTFATLMLEGGCDLFELQQLMGHASIQTTTIYLSATTKHLRTQMAKHPLG